eukprot:scaffold3440_cov135-Isochrysis_galbana.AAC.12
MLRAERSPSVWESQPALPPPAASAITTPPTPMQLHGHTYRGTPHPLRVHEDISLFPFRPQLVLVSAVHLSAGKRHIRM